MDKLVSLDHLIEIVKQAKLQGKKIAWTNGCFDIIHAGYVDYLEKSKSYEERRVVESQGGEIVILPVIEGVSTSIIIEKIKKL